MQMNYPKNYPNMDLQGVLLLGESYFLWGQFPGLFSKAPCPALRVV